MRDPHVKTLNYRLVVDTERLVPKNPPVLKLTYEDFDLSLEGNLLVVAMKRHFGSQNDARNHLAPFLRAWILASSLEWNKELMQFEFEGSEIIDRDPPPPEPGVTVGIGHGSVTLSAAAVGRASPAKHTCSEYPPPPSNFTASPDVELMWTRFGLFREGRDTLLALGYFCLTVLENHVRTLPRNNLREKVAKEFRIDLGILNKLGEWTSERGAPEEARKVGPKATGVPLSSSENKWVREVVKVLIRRVGEYDHDPAAAANLPQITMATLPSI